MSSKLIHGYFPGLKTFESADFSDKEAGGEAKVELEGKKKTKKSSL